MIRAEWRGWLAKGLGWRDEAAPAKQIWRLRQLGHAVPEGLTKGEASDLIDAALAKQQQAVSCGSSG